MTAETKTKEIIWTFTIEGQYAAKSTSTRVMTLTEKQYSVKIQLNNELKKQGVLYVWKNFFAPDLMPKLYPDYDFLITHNIAASDCTNPAALARSRELMTLEQLKEICEEDGLKINFDLYKDPGSLLTAMDDYEKDTKRFLDNQKRREELLQKELEIKKLLRESESAVRANAGSVSIDMDVQLALNMQQTSKQSKQVETADNSLQNIATKTDNPNVDGSVLSGI